MRARFEIRRYNAHRIKIKCLCLMRCIFTTLRLRTPFILRSPKFRVCEIYKCICDAHSGFRICYGARARIIFDTQKEICELVARRLLNGNKYHGRQLFWCPFRVSVTRIKACPCVHLIPAHAAFFLLHEAYLETITPPHF